MKKILTICICVVLLASMCACGKKKSKKVDNSKQNESSSSIADSSSKEDSSSIDVSSRSSLDIPYSALKADNKNPKKQEANKAIIDYLNAIKNKDFNTMKKYMTVSDDKVFSLLKSINFYDLQISSLGMENGNYTYKVSFTTDCKDNNLFKTDTNVFKLYAFKISQDFWISLSPLENPAIDMKMTDYSAYTNMCIFSEMVKTELPTLTEKSYEPLPGSKYTFFNTIAGSALAVYSLSNGGPERFLKETDFSKFAAQNPYLQGIDIKRSIYYNKSTGMLSGWQHGASQYSNNIISTRRLNNSDVEVVINYYADSNSLVKAKTVKYILTGQPIKNLKLISSTDIYNNRLNIAFAKSLG